MNYFQLLDRLEALYDAYKGREFAPAAITRLIERNVPYRDVVFLTNLTINSPLNSITVSGLYDYGDDRWGYTPIEIELAYFKKKKHFVMGKSLTRTRWNQLCFDIASVLGHEYVHLHQHRNRNFRPGKSFRSSSGDQDAKELQEYLGHSDEVDAYAFTVAAEQAHELRSGKTLALESTVMYTNYCDAFGTHHSVVSKLKKQSIKYYKILEGQYNEQNSTAGRQRR
jgi:hypothetical protein